MIKYISYHSEDCSRNRVIKEMLTNVYCDNDIFILLPFSKKKFVTNFVKRKAIINDFFISNYDTHVYDRKTIGKYNPIAWWKFIGDWFNFRFSNYLLSDTSEHFEYWEKLFGKFSGVHFVLPVLADTSVYYPSQKIELHNPIRILFFGSFIPLHGVEIILNAFSMLEKRSIPYQAKMIGNGQTFYKMKKLFSELNLLNVTMDGKTVDEYTLAEEIRKSDIVLGIFGESKKAKSVVPNKAYQALASAKTLVTMNSKAMHEFFSNNEIVLCNNTADDLASSIQDLIENKKEIINYGQKGYTRFLHLYDISKHNFIQFVKNIDGDLHV